MTPILFGVAVLTDGTYPTWLGWGALLAGIVGGVAGFIQAFAGLTVVGTNVLFVIGSIAFTLWFLVVGAMLWGKASRMPARGQVGTGPAA